MRSRERIVVVGAGPAGMRGAERLRELGFNGEIVILGAEGLRPYHRPALSKELLSGRLQWNDIGLPCHTELNATWRLAVPATGLDLRRRIVFAQGGEQLRYDGLLIASGVGNKLVPGAPRHDPRVRLLRTLSDSQALQRALEANTGPTAVVGGGFTGCEIASTLREMGRDVTIISRSKTLFAKTLGTQIGEMIGTLHRDRGVKLALESDILHWLPRRSGVALHLSDGQVLVAGCVVVAVGAAPRTEWLRGSGLDIEDGVLCEPTCHVAGASDVVAAGDVARWPNLRFDTKPRRIEHWIHAVEMGRAAAESLMAGRRKAQPFTPLPRFWSEQHGLRIMAAGSPGMGDDTTTIARNDSGDRMLTGFVRNGQLVGVVGLNCPRAMLHWTNELEQQLQPAAGRRESPVPAQRANPTMQQAPARPFAPQPTKRVWAEPAIGEG